MDDVTRALIDANRRLRRALEAMRDGHQAGIDFLTDLGIAFVGFPTNLTQAIGLAEAVAQAALDNPGDYEFRNTLLRRLLLEHGTHKADCPAWDVVPPTGIGLQAHRAITATSTLTITAGVPKTTDFRILIFLYSPL